MSRAAVDHTRRPSLACGSAHSALGCHFFRKTLSPEEFRHTKIFDVVAEVLKMLLAHAGWRVIEAVGLNQNPTRPRCLVPAFGGWG